MSVADHRDSLGCMWCAWSAPPNLLLAAIARVAVWLNLSHQTGWRMLCSKSYFCFLLLGIDKEHAGMELLREEPGAKVTLVHAGSCPHPPTPVYGGQSQGVRPGPGLIWRLPPGTRDGGEVLM